MIIPSNHIDGHGSISFSLINAPGNFNKGVFSQNRLHSTVPKSFIEINQQKYIKPYGQYRFKVEGWPFRHWLCVH